MRNNNNDKSYVNFPRNFRYDWVKKNGKPTGIAQVYTSNNKCVYQGPVKNRKPHGKEGKCFYSNGKICYEGNWKNGKMDGKGVCYNEKGELCYSGYFKNGKRDGKGKSFGVDGGLCYDGNWKNGKRDGMVNVYNQDGLIRTEEIWEEGKFKRLNSFVGAPCISGVFINAGQRYELSKDTEDLYNASDVDSQQDIQSEQDKKTFMNKKIERGVGDGDLEIDNNSSQSSLKDANKHDKKKVFNE